MKQIIHIIRTQMRNTYFIASIVFMTLFIGLVPEGRSQFRGGEILYGCTPAGNIRFVMHLYRDCGSANTFADTLWLTTNATGFDSIGMTRVASNDISPACDCLASGAPLTCSLATQYGTGAMEELVYTSDAFYPAGAGLMGVPPPTGWQFVFQSCCRAPTDNLAGLSNNFALTTKMFSYLQTPVNYCFDQSPQFLLPPVLTGCAGDPHALFQVPLEPEIDSLSFEITSPLTDASSPINTYQTGYSAVSPLPGPSQHPNNQAVTFDPVTGDLLFLSYTTGSFALAIRVTAWKCGIKVTEIHREVHILITPCHHGSTPELAMQSGILNQGILYSTDSLFAGEPLSAWISALDTTGCASSGPHDVALSAVGAMFGAPMNSNGCLYGPCAQLTPPIPHGGSLTDSTFVQTVFDWQTSGAHVPYVISCGPRPSQHDFVFIASNKKCPVPAVSYGVLRVALKIKEPDPPIPLSCISVLPNGDVTLAWSEHTNTISSFFAYELRYTTNPNGPFVQLTSIQNISQTSYTHQGANAHLQPLHYQLLLKEIFTGGVTPIPFDTAATPTLTVTTGTPSNVAHLSWQGIRDGFPPSSAGVYEVHRELQGGGWSVIGATTATSFIDTFPAGETLVKYRITLTDTVVNNGVPSPCVSESNVAEVNTISVHPKSPEIRFHIGNPVPNPASERVVLPVEVSTEGSLIAVVTDITGNHYKGYTFPVVRGSNTIPLEVASWAPGVYFFTAHYGGMKQVIRLVVVR
jgi:hypothetical protein